MVRATLLQLLRSSKKQFTTTSYLAGFHTSRKVKWACVGAVVAQQQQQQRRWASQGPTRIEKDKKETVPVVVYHGLHRPLVDNVKRATLGCCVYGLLAPVVTTTWMESPLDMKLMLTAHSVILVGLISNKAANLYVHTILWQPGSDSFQVVKTSRWLGATPTPTTSPKTVLFPHVLVTVRCELSLTFLDNDQQQYFVDTHGFRDQAFFERLSSAPDVQLF